ncbi:hypothetical protein [Weissella soli]|uniref:hypothetical protein n=1 Tax=Weissella soli TaxID=155866 RepID=UPI0011BBBEE4|nr:hypothetical protein [Weissella soli]QEA35212.1 hypothetical protein FGL88_05365 [Weissella soli]GJM47730.1 hypothetical protein WSSLDB02_02870 [Weissella soli]
MNKGKWQRISIWFIYINVGIVFTYLLITRCHADLANGHTVVQSSWLEILMMSVIGSLATVSITFIEYKIGQLLTDIFFEQDFHFAYDIALWKVVATAVGIVLMLLSTRGAYLSAMIVFPNLLAALMLTVVAISKFKFKITLTFMMIFWLDVVATVLVKLAA